jgi:hypothetical protein
MTDDPAPSWLNQPPADNTDIVPEPAPTTPADHHPPVVFDDPVPQENYHPVEHPIQPEPLSSPTPPPPPSSETPQEPTPTAEPAVTPTTIPTYMSSNYPTTPTPSLNDSPATASFAPNPEPPTPPAPEASPLATDNPPPASVPTASDSPENSATTPQTPTPPPQAPSPSGADPKKVLLMSAIVTITFMVIVTVVLAVVGMNQKPTSPVADNQPAAVQRDIPPLPTATPSAELSALNSEALSDWETYENEAFAFSLQHPSDWIIKDVLNEKSGDNTYQNHQLLLHIEPLEVDSDYLAAIEVIDAPIATVIQTLKDNFTDLPLTIVNQQTLTFQNQTATELTFTNTETGLNLKYILFEYNALTYTLNPPTDTASLYNQIFSTFSLTE